MLNLKQSPPQGSLAKLKALLEDGDIVKVFHDCQQDVEQLYKHYAIKVQNIFDVRVSRILQRLLYQSIIRLHRIAGDASYMQ